MAHFYLKALHLIGIVSWFAGLFYLIRLFVYHAEAQDKPSPEREILSKQYALMSWRLYYIIAWPAMVITLGFGLAMLLLNPATFWQPWMHLKLLLVAGITVYHIYAGVQMRKLADGTNTWKSHHFRLWNEVATMLLVAIVFLAVLKHSLNFLYGLGGFMAFGVLLMLGIRFYKKVRRD